MQIKGFAPSSFIDYPGRVAAVIWTPRCNFRCPFCYNVDLVFDRPSLTSFTEAEVLECLNKDKAFLDGVVITGGEPTLQPDLADFLARLKVAGLAVKLDTNGSQPELLRKLAARKLISYVALDVKAPLRPEKYGPAAGLAEDACKRLLPKVIDTIDFLFDSRVEYELRTTVAPGLLEEEDFLEIGRFCGSRAGGSGRASLPARYVVQDFFPVPTLNPEFSNRKSWGAERLERLERRLEPFFKEVRVRSR